MDWVCGLGGECVEFGDADCVGACSVLLAITTLLLPALFAKQKRAAKAGGSA